MKNFNKGLLIVQITITIVGIIVGAIAKNWSAMIWAICCMLLLVSRVIAVNEQLKLMGRVAKQERLMEIEKIRYNNVYSSYENILKENDELKGTIHDLTEERKKLRKSLRKSLRFYQNKKNK